MKNKIFFVTGGTGSFGQRFVETIFKKYDAKKVIIFSRDELKQFQMKNNPIFKNYLKKMRFFIGDIRDKERLYYALKQKIDYIVHAAALKQVPIAEYNPSEAIKTNIIGAQNLIDVSSEFKIKKVVALSTDKAVSPINLYGATKLASDKLFISANNYSKSTSYFVVRYGNVFASRGSVVPFFLEKKKTGVIPITDVRMTRFNISLDEAVDFVVFTLKSSVGGELFVPKIPSYKIIDIAKAIAPKAKIKIIGIRPGEKLHEEMITSSDSINTLEFKSFYVITPNSEYFKWNKKKFLKTLRDKKFQKVKDGFSYNSLYNKHYLSISELEKIVFKK
mgnify:CR=1 FL=1